MWTLYVLRCGDGSFYTGITNDVARRLAEHQAGKGARYTRAHLPVTLGAAWQYADRSSATRAEAAFKRLRRSAKQTLIETRAPFDGGPFAFDVLGDPHPYHFCPRCGGPLEICVLEDEEVPVCTVCGRRHYRNAKPCAAVLILRDSHVLLLHRDREPYKGYWDIPGGFLRADELPHDGAIREVREETGLEVRIVEMLGFYLEQYEYQGEFHPILNVYFVAEADGEPVVRDNEADAVRWFPLEALPANLAFAHTSQVIADFMRWVSDR